MVVDDEWLVEVEDVSVLGVGVKAMDESGSKVERAPESAGSDFWRVIIGDVPVQELDQELGKRIRQLSLVGPRPSALVGEGF